MVTGVSMAGFGGGAVLLSTLAECLLVIGNLKPMALASGITPVAATAAIGVFALGNAAGRLTWGWLYDRTASYTPALVLSCCVVGSGIVGSFLLLRMARGSGLQVDVGDTAHSP